MGGKKAVACTDLHFAAPRRVSRFTTPIAWVTFPGRGIVVIALRRTAKQEVTLTGKLHGVYRMLPC